MNQPQPILIAIPTYNERDNVPVLLRGFAEVPGQFHFLFVDDSSPDGTADLVLSIGKARTDVFLLRRPRKLGIGSAHRDGLHWAYAHGYDTAATMDADLTHRPADLLRLVEEREHADVVVGSRYRRRGSLPGWSPFRRLLSHTGHALTRAVLGMPYDATGALRVYNLRRIPREVFTDVGADGYAFLYESLFRLHQRGYRIREVAIELPARTEGRSKMSLIEAMKSAGRLMALGTERAINARGTERASQDRPPSPGRRPQP